MAHIIAVANQKGGVGKTTSAINISAYLAKMGRKVLLVDLDPQGNTSSGLGIQKNKLGASLYDVLQGSAKAVDTTMKTAYENLDILTINGLVAANMLLIPAQAEFYALEGLSQLLNTVKRVRAALNPRLKLLGVLVTMFDGRTSLSTAVIGELNKHFGELVFDTTIPRNIRLAEAPSHGKPIHDYDRFCRGAFAYKKLTKEVVRRVEQPK